MFTLLEKLFRYDAAQRIEELFVLGQFLRPFFMIDSENFGDAFVVDVELGEIEIVGAVSPTDRRFECSAGFYVRSLAHELGHIYCGHLGGDSRSRWADRSGELELGQRELEAEAVSWLICRRLGLETRSAEYLACYVKDGDLERISAFVITAAAHRIEAWRQA